MLTQEALAELAKIVLNHGIPKQEPGDYACLSNEEDDQGVVNICAKDGHVKVAMPRSVWDALRETPSPWDTLRVTPSPVERRKPS